MRIAAAGGGTGGHLLPALAIIEEFQKRHDVEVLYFAVRGKIDETVLPRDHPSFNLHFTTVRGLQRPLLHPKNLKKLIQYRKEIKKIRKKLASFKPDFVISTGGYAGGLLSLAAKNRFPLFIHEQNARPGIANIAASKYARKIFTSFEESTRFFPKNVQDRIVVTGNPIRDLLFNKREVDVPDGIVLVLGGSLGSEQINSIMEKVYEIDRKNIYFHSTGNQMWARKLSRFENVFAFQFIDFMPVLWRKAKFVVARAGATTVAEMIHYKVEGILFPWTGSAESHQLANALEAEKTGLALVVKDGNISPRDILEEINRCRYSLRFPQENAAKKIYELIMGEIG